MAIPEGYSLLARVGFVDRGNYSASATYLAGDVVYYNGSTWSALKDNLKGVTPTNGANWRYMARGFASEVLSAITAKDTSGLVGTAGASVGAQELMDAIADKVATKLLLKTDLVSQIVNDATKAASMAALYAVKQQVDQQNSDLNQKASKSDLTTIQDSLKITSYTLAYNDTYLASKDVTAWKCGNMLYVSGTIRPTITGSALNLITLGSAPKAVVRAPMSGGISTAAYCEVNGKNLVFNVPTANIDYRFSLSLPM